MSADCVVEERQGDIAIITLNRPEKLNALNGEMFVKLAETLQRLGSDEFLRVLVLTGAGDRAFCSGTDIDEFTSVTIHEAHEISIRGQDLCKKIERFPVPVIAAVNGIAAGGGCELVLACHLRFANTAAVFSLPEVKLAMIPGYGGTQRLPREVGLGRSCELMLTGRTVTAAEAHAIGLVNRVTSTDVLHESITIARQIERLSASAIRACLKAVTEGVELPLAEGLALETELFAELFAGEDVREGTAAFLEKREPVFKRN